MIGAIRLTNASAATEPRTYLAGDFLRKGKRPYFAPRGVFDYEAAAKKMGLNPLQSHGVPQFPRANKAFAGGAVPAPKAGKNSFNPYIQDLNNQTKADYEKLLSIHASTDDVAKSLLAQQFAEKNRMQDLLEVEALVLQGLTEEEANDYMRQKKIKVITENPNAARVRFHQGRKNIIQDFARSRGYELPTEIPTEAGIVPTEIHFSGKTELTIRRLADLFQQGKQEALKKAQGPQYHTSGNPIVAMSNAPASSYRANVLPNVDGTNDRGGLNHGDLPESEVDRQRRIFDRKTTKFEELNEFEYNPSTRSKADKRKDERLASRRGNRNITEETIAAMGPPPRRLPREAHPQPNRVSEIVGESLHNRLDALQVPKGARPSTYRYISENIKEHGGSGGIGSRHGLRAIPHSTEEFERSLAKASSREVSRDIINKVAADVLGPRASARSQGTESRRQAILNELMD